MALLFQLITTGKKSCTDDCLRDFCDGVLHHEVPILAKVNQVLIVGEIVLLSFKGLSIEYVSHLNAYKVVAELNEIACIKQMELKDFHPFHLYKGFGRFSQDSFVALLRYRVGCCNHFSVYIHDRIRHTSPFSVWVVFTS